MMATYIFPPASGGQSEQRSRLGGGRKWVSNAVFIASPPPPLQRCNGIAVPRQRGMEVLNACR